ncbi:MAG: Biotin carboxyl carrier protein of acetyl-CoA carboxylase [Bacteroidia bacterium]|nr:Biotin carboxyl carrier protein of acetyl-CoA carboxylase [Bacteroidia bacterium]
MNIKEIQELIKFVSKAGVSEVEIQQKDFKIVIKTGGEQVVVAAPQVVSIPQQVAAPVVQAPVAVAAPKAETPAEPASGGKTVTIKSPMIGTFYRSPGPDKPSFVNVGDEIKQGSVICIIEAMKLFNEIEAEVSGRIVKVLIDDSSPVEYEQPLFLVEPF